MINEYDPASELPYARESQAIRDGEPVNTRKGAGYFLLMMLFGISCIPRGDYAYFLRIGCGSLARIVNKDRRLSWRVVFLFLFPIISRESYLYSF